MKVWELIKELEKVSPFEEIFIWRGNENPRFDYTSNIEIRKPYGSLETNKGLVYNPLILTSSFKQDKKDEEYLKEMNL